MSKSLVSIIVPCYNVEKFIFKALESVLNQTYNNWECIVVNDGSVDNTKQEIEKFSKEDNRFKLISQENQGVSATRNAGLKHAKGDCIYFFDPDDVIAKDCLENLLEQYHPELDIVVGKNAEVLNQNFENSNILEHGIPTLKEFNNTNFIEIIIKNPILSVCWNNLYNAKFIFSNNLSFKEGIVHEDELWVFETLYLAKNVVFNSKVTYYYNIANQNSITKNYGLNNLKCYIIVLDTIYKKYYATEVDKDKKTITGTYILNLQISVTAGFFRFIKKNKNVPYKNEGALLLKKHLNSCHVDNYFEIHGQKAIYFKIFRQYSKADPELTSRLLRNSRKRNIFKRIEDLYLKYLISRNT